MTTARAPRISILISTIGGLDDLVHCLQSVLPQVTAPEVEVVVGGPLTPEAEADIRGLLPPDHREAFRCLDTGRQGYLHGYVAGAEVTTGDWLLLLDQDVIMPSGFIAWLLERIRRDDADVLGFAQLPVDKDTYIARSLRYLNLALKRSIDRDIAISMASMACRRDVYLSLGGFDPCSGLDLHSSTGFVTLARQRGLRIHYEADTYVYDRGHDLAREIWLNQRTLRSIDVSRGPGYYRLGPCLVIAGGLVVGTLMLATRPGLFLKTSFLGVTAGLAAAALAARSVGASVTLAPGMLFGAGLRAAFAMARAAKYLVALARQRSRD